MEAGFEDVGEEDVEEVFVEATGVELLLEDPHVPATAWHPVPQ